MIIVVGRGHSGTRVLSHTLVASGVYMGDRLNESGDLIPAEDMYEACRVMVRHVKYLGNLRWNFSKLHTMPIDPAFNSLLGSYLSSVLKCDAAWKGWKIPETNLAYPWVVRRFPEAHYIYWVRDPRDVILQPHVTDDLGDFGVAYDQTKSERRRRAISWKYQAQIIQATPAPKNWLTVRLEDFVQNQMATLRRMEAFLGLELDRIGVQPEVVGQYKQDEGEDCSGIFREDLVRLGYATTKENTI